MSCPVNFQALPPGVFEAVFTPENVRRSSVNPLSPLSFPKSRSALWDGSPVGEKLCLHLCSQRKPRLVLSEKALRLAQRHARHNNKSRLHCFFLGSVSVDADEHGVTMTLDRFDPGRDQPGASGKVPSALLPGDVLVPCLFSTQPETTSDTVVQSEAELHQCFKAVQQFVGGRQALDLSHLLKVRGHVFCAQQSDAAAFSLSWSSICPSVSVDVHPVRAIPVIPTALLRSLTGINRPLHTASRQRGFLTMDQTRKLLLLLESDPKATNLPLVGIWQSGVTHVQNPQVWAWCLRFLCSSTLQDRVFSESRCFLLVLFGSTHRAPQFFQCRGSGPQLDYQLLTTSHCITLYQQVGSVEGKSLRCELGSDDHSRQMEIFRKAQCSFSSSAAPTAAGLSISDHDSGVEDEDLSPRPSPSPHPPAQQARRVQPSVPELSLLVDGSFTSVQKPPPPGNTISSSSLPPPRPPHLHSTPNSNLQETCACCTTQTYDCTPIFPTPALQTMAASNNHQTPLPSTLHPAPPPSLTHSHQHTPPSSVQAIPPPCSLNLALPARSRHHTPPPSSLHPAPPPAHSHQHTPPPSSVPSAPPKPAVSPCCHTPPPSSFKPAPPPVHSRYLTPPSTLHPTPPPSAHSHLHTPPPSIPNPAPPPPAHSHHTPPSSLKPAPPRPPAHFRLQTPPPPSNQSTSPSTHVTPLSSHNYTQPAFSNQPPPSSAPLPPQSPSSPLSSHHHTPPSNHVSGPTPPSTFPPPGPCSHPPTVPWCGNSPSHHTPCPPVADPATPSWFPRPSCGNQCCDQLAGVIPTDSYQLLLYQDRQLRLLQAQVQMLLESQGKLQASGQDSDTQTARSTASIAVGTGASLFWGNPVQPLYQQEEQTPPPSIPRPPSIPSPSSACRPSSRADLPDRPEGETEDNDNIGQEDAVPPSAQPSDLQSPVLGESASMCTATDEEQNFYHDLMNQLTSRLQDSNTEQEVKEEESRRRSMSAVSVHSKSSQSSSSSQRKQQQPGVDVDEGGVMTSDRRIQQTVEGSSCLASINPAAALSSLQVSEPKASSLFPGGSVDLSLEAKAIALRYLSDSQLSRLSLGSHTPSQGLTSSSDSLLSPCNMSVATRRYMKKYRPIEEEEEEEEDDVREDLIRQPLIQAQNVKLLPQNPVVRDSRPKMKLLAGGSKPKMADKENCPSRRSSLVRASSHQTEGSLGNILDLSRLRQLPKLF